MSLTLDQAGALLRASAGTSKPPTSSAPGRRASCGTPSSARCLTAASRSRKSPASPATPTRGHRGRLPPPVPPRHGKRRPGHGPALRMHGLTCCKAPSWLSSVSTQREGASFGLVRSGSGKWLVRRVGCRGQADQAGLQIRHRVLSRACLHVAAHVTISWQTMSDSPTDRLDGYEDSIDNQAAAAMSSF